MRSALNALSIYLPALFIAYCAACLWACPSAALAAATAGELFLLMLSVLMLRSKFLVMPAQLMNLLPASFKRRWGTVGRWAQQAKLALLISVAIVASCDFFGFALALGRQYQASAAVYSLLPVSYWLGTHPAFTLEMLAGAMVEAKKFKEAEPLYATLLKVRRNVSGKESDLVGAMYCDIGDLCVREGDLKTAEQWYRRSVAMGPRTGRGYGALATTLRETNQFEESERYYLLALDLRERVFGKGSKQYMDTLRAYNVLKTRTNTKGHASLPGCQSPPHDMRRLHLA
jgi:tetratricopeptide (TPR) repeat protein